MRWLEFGVPNNSYFSTQTLSHGLSFFFSFREFRGVFAILLRPSKPAMFQHLDALDNLVRVQHVIVILRGIRTPTVNRRLCAPGTVRRRRTAKVQRT